ncbi:hypothetical protein [Ktedonobacter racemifer]|uniref:Uncharacterized protein n=1 Tax=Ktedonobacter racemifer DSM 44963 TaxID=485913 RepID=D6TX62_KTERA|nr:hypothetical protein [Ktedonobacter racemifer]EFH84795.1 hypothetical protein Krac_5902 [Ktedonobacter racemifer DSM 44963]
MAFQIENLRALASYRLNNPADFQQHCKLPNALIASLRLARNGLVVHHCNCAHMQNAVDKPDLDIYPKFGFLLREFPTFQTIANNADIPLFFTCPSKECRLGLANINNIS